MTALQLEATYVAVAVVVVVAVVVIAVTVVVNWALAPVVVIAALGSAVEAQVPTVEVTEFEPPSLTVVAKKRGLEWN